MRLKCVIVCVRNKVSCYFESMLARSYANM